VILGMKNKIASKNESNILELNITLGENGQSRIKFKLNDSKLNENDIFIALNNAFLDLKHQNITILKDIMSSSILVLSDNPKIMKDLEETLKQIACAKTLNTTEIPIERNN